MPKRQMLTKGLSWYADKMLGGVCKDKLAEGHIELALYGLHLFQRSGSLGLRPIRI